MVANLTNVLIAFNSIRATGRLVTNKATSVIQPIRKIVKIIQFLDEIGMKWYHTLILIGYSIASIMSLTNQEDHYKAISTHWVRFLSR